MTPILAQLTKLNNISTTDNNTCLLQTKLMNQHPCILITTSITITLVENDNSHNDEAISFNNEHCHCLIFQDISHESQQLNKNNSHDIIITTHQARPSTSDVASFVTNKNAMHYYYSIRLTYHCSITTYNAYPLPTLPCHSPQHSHRSYHATTTSGYMALQLTR